MPTRKPSVLSRIKQKLEQPFSCEDRAFSPLDPHAGWLLHLIMAIYLFLVVLILMILHWQRFSNQKETSCPPLVGENSNTGVCVTHSPAD